MCVLIKVYRLDFALEAADGRSKFRRGTCAKWEITEERGTSSLHCQRLIRSGIKRFVTVEAEERGRAGGWMLLCPPCSEPRNQLSAVLIKKVICRIKPGTEILSVDQSIFDFHVLRPVVSSRDTSCDSCNKMITVVRKPRRRFGKVSDPTFPTFEIKWSHQLVVAGVWSWF